MLADSSVRRCLLELAGQYSVQWRFAWWDQMPVATYLELGSAVARGSGSGLAGNLGTLATFELYRS